MKRLASVLLLGCFLSCAKRLPDERFRTLQAGTAFQRAKAALEGQGFPIHKADEATGVLQTQWRDANFRSGLPPRAVHFRYLATVKPDATDQSADVRLAIQVVECGILDSSDPDRMGNECGKPWMTPDVVLESYEEVKRAFRDDVFRRE
jgi:hypothetical protein